jgi:membrane protein
LKRKNRYNINRKAIFDGLKYYAKGLYNKSDEDHIWVLSSGIAFNLIICAIPFTLILFSILSGYLSSEATTATINRYLRNFVGLTPELKSKIQSLVFSRIEEMSHYSTLTAIIGTIGILWTASSLFSTIRDVLNRIYKTKMEVFFLWGKLKDIGMVFLTSLLFFLSLLSTFILSIIKSIEQKFFSTSFFGLGIFDKLISLFLGLLFSFLMFYIIYKLVPHGKINNKVVLTSSVTSTISWELLKILFTVYLINFSNFTAVYGAYAALVAVIFWIYYSSFTFVLGAEIGQLYTERKLL